MVLTYNNISSDNVLQCQLKWIMRIDTECQAHFPLDLIWKMTKTRQQFCCILFCAILLKFRKTPPDVKLKHQSFHPNPYNNFSDFQVWNISLNATLKSHKILPSSYSSIGRFCSNPSDSLQWSWGQVCSTPESFIELIQMPMNFRFDFHCVCINDPLLLWCVMTRRIAR